MVSALRIGDGDLIDDLRLVRTIQMAVDLLQVKPGHCLSDSFHQHRKLFLRTVRFIGEAATLTGEVYSAII